MPPTSKGRKILRQMQNQYGIEEGEAIFYASRNKGWISDVDFPRLHTPSRHDRRKLPK